VRAFVLLLAAGLAAGALWWLYAERDPVGRTQVTRGDVEDPGVQGYMGLKYGTLTVQVKGPDLKPVMGARVGWDSPEGPHLYYTDIDGRRTMTDVPLGPIKVVVVAQGFERIVRDARIEAGVPEELSFILPAPTAGGGTR
jgi:hypothetical protein